jgi:hypothetical protein
MDRVADQICSGMLPYITTNDIEDCLRNRIAAKAGVQFFKNCFEAVMADKSGVFVLNGGAAAACHVDEQRNMLKCLDFDYYNSSKEWLQITNMQRRLQACIQSVFENLTRLTSSVRMQNYLTVIKCFQNGAFRFNDNVHLRLLPHIEIVRTSFNEEFDLIRFALQVEMWSLDGVEEYIDQKWIINRDAVAFNVYFVNVRVIKQPFFGERCTRFFNLFGYHVLVSPLHRVLNDQIMCLLKDIFTNKEDFKVQRRETLIRALFEKMPQEVCYVCDNVTIDRHRNENITSFCKKTLDIYGPALGCHKLVYAFLRSDMFVDQIPHYVANHFNHPWSWRNCEQKWKYFMSVLCLL